MKIRVFRDVMGGWRWTCFARNGKKVATCGEGYKRRVDAIRCVKKYLKKAPIVFVGLLLSLTVASGCASLQGFFKTNYLYLPSVVQRATSADGKINITDAIIVAYSDSVGAAWMKRQQISIGIEKGSELESGFLSILPTIFSFVAAATPIGAIISVATSLLNKFTSVIDPGNREGAYADGLKLLDQAKNAYFVAQKDGKIPDDKLTDAGRALWANIDDVIGRVNDALANRIGRSTPIAGSPDSSLNGAYTIKPVTP